jgi:hypothetical protein
MPSTVKLGDGEHKGNPCGFAFIAIIVRSDDVPRMLAGWRFWEQITKLEARSG